MYPFGQSFKYTFYPIVDSEAIQGIPTQTPAIYVYRENNKPSRDQAALGTGSLHTINTWTQERNGFYFTVPEIVDPEPTGEITKRTYWIAINFILKASGQTQTVIKALEMERVTGHQVDVYVTYPDLLQHWSEIGSYFSLEVSERFAANAKKQVITELNNQGFNWSQVTDPSQLTMCVIYKTLANLNADRRKESGDNFDKNFELFYSTYKSALTSLQLEYDADNDGAKDDKPQQIGGYVFLTR